MAHKFTGTMAERDAWAIQTAPNYAQKFWSRVVKQPHKNGCWLYPAKGRKGYGAFYFANAAMPPHRYSLLLAVGRAEGERYACHKCANRNCVKPAHLYWGTNDDNVADRIAFGADCRQLGAKHGMATITEIDATAIWVDMALTAGKDKEIAARTGIPLTTVKNITAGNSWVHITDKLQKLGYVRPNRNKNCHDSKGEEVGNSVLTERDVVEIRRYRDQGCGTREIVERTGLPKSQVGNVVADKIWQHVPCERFRIRMNYQPIAPGRTNVFIANRVREQLAQDATVEDIMLAFRLHRKTVEGIRDRKLFVKQKGVIL